MTRALLALLTASALLVAACGSEDDPGLEGEERTPLVECDAALEHIEVTGPVGSKPAVSFEAPLEAGDTRCQVLEEGEGDGAEIGDLLVVGWMLLNGRTGEEYVSRYEDGPVQRGGFLLTDGLPRGIRQGMVGARPGSRTVTVIAPIDGFQLRGGDPAAGLEPDDPLVMVSDVVEVRHPLERADGQPVDPQPGLPTVSVDGSGVPSITVPGGQPPPTALVVQPLLQGDGEQVASGSRVLVHYTGVLYASGEQFDSSWGSEPTIFTIGAGQVIPAWDTGITGASVGSRLLIVAPPDAAYGPEGFASAGIGGTDTLVFVVDILDTW